MLSTSKVPPYWGSELELQGYPFRTWLQAVRIWNGSSELAVEARGGAAVQRLGEVARHMGRNVDPRVLRNCREELNQAGNAIQTTCLEMLLRGHSRKFGAQEFETSVSSVIQLLTFQRPRREPIDDTLGRFELIRQRALKFGDLQMGIAGLGWMLLHQLGIHEMRWPLLLLQRGSPWASSASRGY